MGSSWVHQAEDGLRGRHLVASNLITPGVSILSQPAVAWVLYDDQVGTRCHWSLQLASNPLRCGACKHARYASKHNQREAWAAGHKEECAALAACFPKVPPPTVRLVARLFWLARRRRAGSSPVSDYGSVDEVTSLQHHWEELPDSKKELFAQMAALTRCYMQGTQSDEVQLPDTRTIALMLARCACNNHTICDDELRPIGVGLYPKGALVNHSSAPNAMQTFQGQQICFKALQPIQEGSEVTISYVELAATRAEQQQQLLEQYYFDIDASFNASCTAEHVDGQIALQLAATKTKQQQPQHDTDHESHSKEAQEPRLASCQAGNISAGLYREPPCSMNAADGQLTAVTTVSGRSAAHVMAYIYTESSSNIQASFPHHHLLSASLEDDDAPQQSGRPEAALQHPQENEAHLADSAMQQTEQQKLRVQCWGTGLIDMSQSQLQEVAQGMSRLLLQHKQCEAWLATGRNEQAQALASSTLHLASSLPAPVQALGQHHIWRMRLNEVLLRACIASGKDWLLVLSTAKRLQPVYEMVYPKVWPLKGLHYAAMSKIAALLQDDHPAGATASLALQQLQYTHTDSPILEEVRQILFESKTSIQNVSNASNAE